MSEVLSSGLFTQVKRAPDMWEHQLETKQFGLNHPVVYDMSDPGTGKTRSWIEVMLEILSKPLDGGGRRCALVLAPKSILKPAWGDDLESFARDKLSFSIANASNRAKAFDKDVDVYITNHDGVKWIARRDKKKKLENWGKVFKPDRHFELIIIDEMTAFKHSTSQRSKALKLVADQFERRSALSGTPNPNGMLDLWHQIFVLDNGERLGNQFYKYRSVVCAPTQVGPQPNMVKWDDRPGADDAVADLISDITIRHVFEECQDIPPNHAYYERFVLSPKHRKAYEVLKEHSLIEYEDGAITAFNAGTVANKLLQMSSGAVYTQAESETEPRVSETFSTDRYELVLDLIEAREQCVVAFVWRHQKEALVALAEARGISYAILDGTVTSTTKRNAAIEAFQAGLIKVLFIHPQTGAHGLTLTAGTSTIWSSPIYNAELFTQFNKRIYRGGQTRKTETVMVCGEGTIDEEVYERLQQKLDRLGDLLEMIRE